MPQSSLALTRPEAAVTVSGRCFPWSEALESAVSTSILLAVILTAQLMVVLDATIVNVALPHIQKSLDFSSSALSWVLNAYILTFGGFLLLGARAGDLFGRRRVFLLGIAVFTLSSLVGGLAVSGWALLAARAVQGMGAALAAPCALSLLTTAFPEGPQRVRAIGLYTTVSAAGGATGLVAGGLLTELVSWRWVMFVNVPIGLCVWLLVGVVLVETDRQDGHFDLIGALTCTVGVSGIVLGLVEAGVDGVDEPRLVGISLRRRRRLRLLPSPREPGVGADSSASPAGPCDPQRGQRLTRPALCRLLRPLLLHGAFLQDVQSYSPLRAGLAFVPMPVSVFLASQLTSRVLLRRLPEKAVMILGTASPSSGCCWPLASERHRPIADRALPGPHRRREGMTLVALTSASLADVEPEIAGAASGLVNVSQQLGAAVGLAVLVTVFNSLAGHGQLVPGATSQRRCIPSTTSSPWPRLCAGCAGDRGVRRAAALHVQSEPGTRQAPGERSVLVDWSYETREDGFSRLGIGRHRGLSRRGRSALVPGRVSGPCEEGSPSREVVVDDLESQGLVRRKPHPVDRRAQNGRGNPQSQGPDVEPMALCDVPFALATQPPGSRTQVQILGRCRSSRVAAPLAAIQPVTYVLRVGHRTGANV